MKRNSTIFFMTTTTVFLVAGVIFSFTYFSGEKNTSRRVESKAVSVIERHPPAGFKEYKNPRYDFSFFYPGELSIEEFEEGEGATTIIVQNPEEGVGFQIFIVPYSERQISPERFQRDVPSGVMTEPIEATLAGVPALRFFSENILLGETLEVWFLKNGHLFEVTTLKSLDEWLETIMQTWEFN